MNMDTINPLILSLIVFTPLIGAAVLALLPRASQALRPLALLTAFVTLFLTAHLPVHYAGAHTADGFAFEQNLQWIASPNIHYHLGVDGFSLWIVVATALLVLLCLLTGGHQAAASEKYFYILVLLLESALLGIFTALDLFLFYCFWELAIVPMALLTGLFGQGLKRRAAMRFFLYMMASSLFLLGGIIWLYQQTGSFDYTTLRASLAAGHLSPQSMQWLFLCFFVTFAVKAPLFPVHAWLPEIHAAAPTVVSVLMLKMGVYGLLRFNLGLFPKESLANQSWIAALAIATIIYGALLALAQTNLKRLLAFSSVSHAGLAVLAVFSLTPMALSGAAFQIVSIGLTTGALFLLAGALYERSSSYEIIAYGGWAATHPRLAAFFLLFTLSSIGLPLTSGFVGEFVMLTGAYLARPLYGILGASTVVLGAWYMLRLYKQLFFGKPNRSSGEFTRALDRRELAAFWVLTVAVLLLGLLPSVALAPANNTANSVVTSYSVPNINTTAAEVQR